jgi:hypothetical protein
MKFLCRRCGKDVEHTCSGASPSKTVVPCPLKGVVWVYVTDLDGNGLKGVTVSLKDGDATPEKTTDDMGLAQFPGLEPGSKDVKIIDLGGKAPEFYMPEERSGSVSVAKGQTSIIELHVPTWIEIRVEDESGTLVEDLRISVVCADGQLKELSKANIKDGAYHAGEMGPGDCQVSLVGVPDAEWKGK